MAATLISSIIGQARAVLNEPVANLWSDEELRDILVLGVCDLWGSILDLHQAHFFKINEEAILRTDANEISGVPADCFRILLIEPLDTTSSGTNRGLQFTPKAYNDNEFIVARTRTSVDPAGTPVQIIYAMSGVGPPISAPRILTAPPTSSDVALRIAYNPSPDVQDYNPIPGLSDNALKAWTLAYAMAKEAESGEEKVPNGEWLAIYSTEKQNILTRLTPRQEQEPDVVDDLFMGVGNIW